MKLVEVMSHEDEEWDGALMGKLCRERICKGWQDTGEELEVRNGTWGPGVALQSRHVFRSEVDCPNFR